MRRATPRWKGGPSSTTLPARTGTMCNSPLFLGGQYRSLAGSVVDDGPPFQRGVALLIEDQPIAGFPDRHGNHIAGCDLALLRVRGIDVDAAFFLGARLVDGGEIVLQLGLQLRIGEADGTGGGKVQSPEIAGIEQQYHLLAVRFLFFRGSQARA